MVAIAEAPAPMAITAHLATGSAERKARQAAGRNGISTRVSTACSANTTVAAEVPRASGSRKIASVPHSAAASATNQVRSLDRTVRSVLIAGSAPDQASAFPDHLASSSDNCFSRARMAASALSAASRDG